MTEVVFCAQYGGFYEASESVSEGFNIYRFHIIINLEFQVSIGVHVLLIYLKEFSKYL